MGFFLIARGAHDDVRLLSDALFATRQDAMAELSRLSAQPAYDAWEAEVFVADLDRAAPVLLVRPQVAARAEDLAPAMPEVSEQQGTLEAVAAAEAEPLAAEPETAQPAAAADIANEPAPADSATAEGETSPAEGSPVADVVPAAGLAAGVLAAGGFAAAGLAAAATPNVETEAAGLTSPLPGENDDLREALLRTTQRMAAEGVEPPASAGLAPATAGETAQEEPSALASEASAAAMADASATQAAAEGGAQSGDTAEPEAPAWPWSDLDAAQVAAEAAPAAQPSADAAPALVAESADAPDEAIAGEQNTPGTPGSTPREPMSTLMATTPEWTSPEPSDQVEDEPESDFILDLEEIQPVQLESHETGLAHEAADPSAMLEPSQTATPEAVRTVTTEAAQAATLEARPADPPSAENPAAELASPSTASLLTEYTCDDCVYVGTCPNRDQRLPKDCGSFQWR